MSNDCAEATEERSAALVDRVVREICDLPEELIRQLEHRLGLFWLLEFHELYHSLQRLEERERRAAIYVLIRHVEPVIWTMKSAVGRLRSRRSRQRVRHPGGTNGSS